MQSVPPTTGQTAGDGGSTGTSTGPTTGSTGDLASAGVGSNPGGQSSAGAGTGSGATGNFASAGASSSTGSATGTGSTGAPGSTGSSGSLASTGSTSNVAGELKSDVRQLSTTAGNRIHSELDARKGTAATQAKSVGSAIERAAGELGDDVPQWLRSAFQQGAQQVQRLADTLEQKDSRQLVSDIQQMARTNPGTFLAGCAALGFAAARIFKAGAPDSGTGSQTTQTRFPPPQVDEPMFRSSGSTEPSYSSRTGEFV